MPVFDSCLCQAYLWVHYSALVVSFVQVAPKMPDVTKFGQNHVILKEHYLEIRSNDELKSNTYDYMKITNGDISSSLICFIGNTHNIHYHHFSTTLLWVLSQKSKISNLIYFSNS